jgi:hypothetical protein
MRFLGRLNGRPLPPGRYTLVPELVRRGQRIALRRVTVAIVPARRKVSSAAADAPLKVECPAGGTASGGGATDTDAAATGGAVESGEFTPTGRLGGDDDAGATDADGNAAGVAGVQKTSASEPKSESLEDLPVLSRIIPTDSPVPPLVLAVLALVAIAFGSLALIALVLRYFRGTSLP